MKISFKIRPSRTRDRVVLPTHHSAEPPLRFLPRQNAWRCCAPLMVIGNPLVLWNMSHIGGGEHPPNFTVSGQTSCEACRGWHGC